MATEPNGFSSRTTVRLPEDIHRRAKLAAVWSGKKLQDFVAAALEEYLVQVETAIRLGKTGPVDGKMFVDGKQKNQGTQRPKGLG